MRKTKTKIYIMLLIGLSACDAKVHDIRFVTPAAQIDRGIAQSLTDLLVENSPFEIELTREPMAEKAALQALALGEADIALVSNTLPFRDDVTTVMPLYPTILHIARRADGGRRDIPELFRGASIYAGPEGSASQVVFERVAIRIGLSRGDYTYTRELEAGQPDVVIVFAPISPERMAEHPDLILASMGTPQEIGSGGLIDAAVLLNPQFRTFVIPAGTYGGTTPEPIVTVAVDKILVARSDLEPTVVYDLINEILRLQPALAAAQPGLFQQLSSDFDTSGSTYVLHAGSQAYLQRDAPSIYERYSGIAEVVVTLMVGLVSAGFATIRVLTIRRKQLIDKYYAATLEIRDTARTSTNPAEHEEAIARIRALQDDAFQMLVDEKLSADESFRIFITLSNDVLRQLGATGIHDRLSDT